MNYIKYYIFLQFLLSSQFLIGQPLKVFQIKFDKDNAVPAYRLANGAGYDFSTKQGVKGKGFYFSVKLPEGNYLVKATLSSINGTYVKAESRRLMLENIKTKKGQFVTKDFIVNIKDRVIDKQTQVKLKDRELNKLDWDEKLTLEFDSNVTLHSLSIEKVENQVTIFLAGNSTVVNGDSEPWAAWGQMITAFFKPGIAIANHAESGLTLGTFLSSNRLEKICTVMKPGDYLFIEFGHNDQKDKGEQDGAYKAYTERLKFFIKRVKEKGGIPILLTPTARRKFDENGELVNTLGDFPAAVREVAISEQVKLIDLNQMTTTMFNAMGVEQSKKAYVHYPSNTFPNQPIALADDTHFNPFGAYQIARCVIEGIKLAQLPLVKYLAHPKDKFNPSQPDSFKNWQWPASLIYNIDKPDGN